MPEKNYTESDLEDSLRRAFVDNKFPSIMMDGHECRNKFLRDGINYGFNQGWLKVKGRVEESQYSAVDYILTERGKEHFGLK